MRSALVYLTVTKLKNQVKSAIKSPAKLIYALFFIALLVFIMLSPTNDASSTRDISEFYSIIFIFYTIMFFLILINSFSNGATMFSLSDVTMLFPAPIKPQKILFYGLLRQMGTSLLLGFFILFQYSWMNNMYGVSFAQLFLVILGYGLSLFLAQLIAMVLYSRISHSDSKKRTAKLVSYGFVGALFVASAIYVLPSTGTDYNLILTKAVEFFNSPFITSFPVAGWTSGIVTGIMTANLLQILVSVSALTVLSVILVFLISKTGSGYYEDVIKATEISQSAITAQKEGKVGEVIPQNVRVGKIGLDKGSGASAIYYKHMVENRRSGILFVSNMSLIFMAIAILISFFMRDVGIVGIFAMATYMQLFSVALGRFPKELAKPYIYLIPESPLKKLLYAIKEGLVSNTVEAVVLFAIAGIIIQANPIEIVLCIAARITFSLLFTAANIAVERVFGSATSKVLTMLFYILVVLLMLIPGVALIILFSVLGLITELSVAFVFVAFIIGNILTSLLTLFICKNVLQYAELNNK